MRFSSPLPPQRPSFWLSRHWRLTVSWSAAAATEASAAGAAAVAAASAAVAAAGRQPPQAAAAAPLAGPAGPVGNLPSTVLAEQPASTRTGREPMARPLPLRALSVALAVSWGVPGAEFWAAA